MDFKILIVFVVLNYLRPQEWFTALSSIHFIEILSIGGVWSMFVIRKLKPRDLFRVPVDWMVTCYFITTLISGFQFWTNLGYMEAVLLFYYLAACSLDSIPKIQVFLKWWAFLILFIACLAIASLYGFDPLGGLEIINGPMKGRLILNLSLFDNPNALAHSVIPAIPLIYYLVFWRRAFMKIGLLLMAVPVWCIYLTQSKGAVLSGFATLLATLTFGRSKPMQVVILILAVAFGYTAIYQLPRMHELDNARTDPAIQGRVAAFSLGLQAMRTHVLGIGFGNFHEYYYRYGPMEEVHGKMVHYGKATHSTYNQSGAEFGYQGLFFLIAVLYCCIRTLLLVKSEDDDEERIRRALFAMVIAYAVSSWMVDFGYRAAFFMFAAAISGFHRHLLRKHSGEPAAEVKPDIPAKPWLRRLPPMMPGLPVPGLVTALPSMAAEIKPSLAASPAGSAAAAAAVPAFQGASSRRVPAAGRVLGWHKPKVSIEEALRKKFIWTRLGFPDLVITLLLTYLAILYWEYLIRTM